MNGSRLYRLLLIVALLAAATGARADVFRAGEFRLSEGEAEHSYDLSARLPTGVVTSLVVEWPERCVQTGARQQPNGNQSRIVVSARCDRSLRAGDEIRTPWPLDGARLTLDLGGQREIVTLRRASGGMTLPILAAPRADRSVAELAREFLWQGMLHIWFGWDHLAFVLCLCLLARGYALLGLVTMFTLGHSLSMGLAFFGVVTIPIPPVEAVIALSIVLMAREALLTPSGTTARLTRPLAVVSVFGLIHGLGFASALGELGVSYGERWPALIFFNLGVELGQVVFVAAVIALLAAVKPLRLAPYLRSGALFCAGGIGFFWGLERLAAFI